MVCVEQIVYAWVGRGVSLHIAGPEGLRVVVI